MPVGGVATGGAMETARGLSVVAAMALALGGWLYYRHGLSAQFWPDSFGYLAQAQGIAGLAPYARPADRSAGYPALLALALLTPRPALVLVLMQMLIAIGSLAAVYRLSTRVILPRCGIDFTGRRVCASGLLAATALAGLYSGLHVHIAAVLTEILFAAAALLAVLAAVWLIRPDRAERRPWLEAPAVAALGALPLLVKPHWLFAAVGLAVLPGVWLWRVTAPHAAPAWRRLLHLVLAVGLSTGAAYLTVLPDRLLAQRYSARDHALFGPRAAFCNHAHLIMATLARRPGLMLQDDPSFDQRLRERVGMLVASHASGWKLLGYNGDVCSYSSELSRLLEEHFSDFRDEGRFLIGSLARVAIADPLPYARKVVVQVAFGFLTAFDRFAIHARTGIDPSRKGSAFGYPPPAFFAGVRDAEEVGPLGSRDAMKTTVPGYIAQGLLAAIFFSAGMALLLAVLAALTLPWRAWRSWTVAERQMFAVFVALPLGVLAAHHLLVALVHSFDVWRYGFNMFFVNLLFMGSSALFWLGGRGRWRAKRPM